MLIFLLFSCGRKNDLFEASLENNRIVLDNLNKFYLSSKKNEIYQ